MKLLRYGKTKDVYELADGNILLRFKDTVTGNAATGESDPGGNDVVGTKQGVASAAVKMTSYYFDILNSLKIPTHFVKSDLVNNDLIVKPAKFFGKGLEFVVRYKAEGGFVRRFGDFIAKGDKLDSVYEVTLKDDARGDPPITCGIAVALGLMTVQEWDGCEKLVKDTCLIVKKDLEKKGLDLIDIKVEVGIVDNKIAIIDEISGGNMRVSKDGRQLDYVELAGLLK